MALREDQGDPGSIRACAQRRQRPAAGEPWRGRGATRPRLGTHPPMTAPRASASRDRRRPADHRRGRRARALGEVRRGGRHRPDHHLQLRPLPDGRPRLAVRAAAVRRRQRDRRRHGARGAPHRRAHAGARRRLRHRPVPADGRLPRRAVRIGFSGVQNFPTVGLFDGTFRQNLEETGMGYGLEVDLIRPRRARRTCSPAPYVFTVDEAVGDGRRRAPTCSSRTWA